MTGTPCPAGGFPNPYGVAVSPEGTYIYGTNYGGATVAVVDTATGARRYLRGEPVGHPHWTCLS